MARRSAHNPARKHPVEDARSAELLDALEAIFLGEGFRKVSVASLAARLHVSKRSLYELAPSKEDLFMRVFDRYLSRLREQCRRGAEAAASPEQAFEPYLAPAIDAARKLSPALFRDMEAHASASALWERHQRERMAGLRVLVERCVDEGRFRGINPVLVAEVVAASLRRIREPAFLKASGLSYREAVAELYGLLLHGMSEPRIGSPPGAKKASGKP